MYQFLSIWLTVLFPGSEQIIQFLILLIFLVLIPTYVHFLNRQVLNRGYFKPNYDSSPRNGWSRADRVLRVQVS